MQIASSGRVGDIKFLIVSSKSKVTAEVITPKKHKIKKCTTWNTAEQWINRTIQHERDDESFRTI